MIEYAIAGAILGACAHRERGSAGNLWAISDRFPATVCMAATVFLLTHSMRATDIAGTGYFFYIIFGWNAYFIQPEHFKLIRTIGAREREIGWIDWLIAKLPPYDLIRNAAGMYLRSLFIVPLFANLAILQGSWRPLVFGFMCASWISAGYILFPFIAYVTGKDFDQTSYAEGWAGAGIIVFILGMMSP